VSRKKGDVLIGATAWRKKRTWKRPTAKYSVLEVVLQWCYRLFTDVSVSIGMARINSLSK